MSPYSTILTLQIAQFDVIRVETVVYEVRHPQREVCSTVAGLWQHTGRQIQDQNLVYCHFACVLAYIKKHTKSVPPSTQQCNKKWQKYKEYRGSLLLSSWHILVLSWLWRAPNPLAGVIRPLQAWPPTALPTGRLTDLLTDWPPTLWNLCLFTPVHSHNQQHSLQKCEVCTHQCIQTYCLGYCLLLLSALKWMQIRHSEYF